MLSTVGCVGWYQVSLAGLEQGERSAALCWIAGGDHSVGRYLGTLECGGGCLYNMSVLGDVNHTLI